MPPHLVRPDLGDDVGGVGAAGIDPFAPQCQSGELQRAFAAERAVEGEEEQLPPRLVFERLYLGAAVGKAPCIGGDGDLVVSRIDPFRQGQRCGQRQLSVFGADVDSAVAGDFVARAGRVIGDDVAFAEIDRGDIAVDLDPIGQHSGGVRALLFAFGCDGGFAGSVVAGGRVVRAGCDAWFSGM